MRSRNSGAREKIQNPILPFEQTFVLVNTYPVENSLKHSEMLTRIRVSYKHKGARAGAICLVTLLLLQKPLSHMFTIAHQLRPDYCGEELYCDVTLFAKHFCLRSCVTPNQVPTLVGLKIPR